MATAYLDETGIHIPEYADILADLKDAFRAVYGPDIYLEPDSQDGALCAVFAKAQHDCFLLAAAIYHSYAPSTAQGVALDAVVGVNGIRRNAWNRKSSKPPWTRSEAKTSPATNCSGAPCCVTCTPGTAYCNLFCSSTS